MESFVCIFCPAVVGFLLYEKCAKKKYDLKYSFFFYLIAVMASYCLSTMVSKKIFGAFATPENLNSSPAYAIKYLLMATAINAAIGIVVGWLKGNMKLEIVIKKEKKKNEKVKKRS